MINCDKCGKFISHDSSNLPYLCDDCEDRRVSIEYSEGGVFDDKTN